MKMKVSKMFKFEAAHSLPYLPEGHKCRRLHGHSYRFEVECEGEVDDRGFVIDYADIAKAINPLVEKMDHQNLNDLFDFKTTAENLAIYIFTEANKSLPVSGVAFYETASTKVFLSKKDFETLEDV